MVKGAGGAENMFEANRPFREETLVITNEAREIVERFGQVVNGNMGRVRQIGNSAGHGLDAQHMQMREMQLSERGFQELFSCIVQLTILLNLANRAQISIHLQMCGLDIASVLDGTGGFHTLTNGGRTFFWDVAQDLFPEQRNFHLECKARTKHLFEALPVVGKFLGRTSARSCRIASISTGTGFHGGHQEKVGRKGHKPFLEGDGDNLCFHRLSQRGQEWQIKGIEIF
jgi:hypothetical protein